MRLCVVVTCVCSVELGKTSPELAKTQVELHKTKSDLKVLGHERTRVQTFVSRYE